MYLKFIFADFTQSHTLNKYLSPFSFFVNSSGKQIVRKRIFPAKYNIYWDASIPMQYYKESFIDFENYLLSTGYHKMSTPENPHANSDVYLEKFANYEKWMKADCKREWKRYIKRKMKESDRSKKVSKSTEANVIKEKKVSTMGRKNVTEHDY